MLNQVSVDLEDKTFLSEIKDQKIIYKVKNKNKETLFKKPEPISEDTSISAYIIDPYIPHFLDDISVN